MSYATFRSRVYEDTQPSEFGGKLCGARHRRLPTTKSSTPAPSARFRRNRMAGRDQLDLRRNLRHPRAPSHASRSRSSHNARHRVAGQGPRPYRSIDLRAAVPRRPECLAADSSVTLRIGFGLSRSRGAPRRRRVHVTCSGFCSRSQRPVTDPHIRVVSSFGTASSVVGHFAPERARLRFDSSARIRSLRPITRWQLPRVLYFRTRPCSCVRDNPSRRAAFVLLPRQSLKTFAIVVRSTAPRSVVSSRNRRAPDCRFRWVASMSAPSQTIAARSRTLRSSRTLPGQSYSRSAVRASRVRPAGGRPNDLPISCRNVSLSGRISDGRSRNGGIRMSKTPRR